jgi:predicted dehydrogenase
MDRRQFGKAALVATASSYSKIAGANDRIRLGAIGTGGRCQSLMGLANQAGGCEIVAVSDCNPLRMDKAKARHASDARAESDYRKLLEDKSIDAVIIGSPDHWHVPMLVASMESGKDIYIEKPLTHGIEEGQKAIEAVKKSGRVVQVGYQQRSYPHMIEARDLIRAGELGHITLVQSYWYQNYNRPVSSEDLSQVDWKQWLGTALPRPFDPLRYQRWRWFWDYGGGTLTDLYSHWVDTIHWIMDDSVPVTAQASGGLFQFAQWECPDTLTASYRYPKGFLSTYDSTLVQSFEDGGMVFRGDKATMRLSRSGYDLFTEAAIREQRSVHPAPAKSVKADGDGTLPHMANFLECVRSRKTPRSDVETAVAAANAAHWGNLAFKTGRTTETSRNSADWQPLWNGRDLSDFIVDTESCWAVRDGIIVGRHDGLKYNDFLRTRRQYDDFELRLMFRLKNGVGNSGIQFRSEPVPDSHEVSGYQADIGEKYWGCLYDESRRKKVLAGPPEMALANLDKTAWHNYVIRAEGNFITLHLDGVRTVHYVETAPNILERGFIALQVHSGPGIEVEFKDLMIRALS